MLTNSMNACNGLEGPNHRRTLNLSGQHTESRSGHRGLVLVLHTPSIRNHGHHHHPHLDIYKRFLTWTSEKLPGDILHVRFASIRIEGIGFQYIFYATSKWGVGTWWRFEHDVKNKNKLKKKSAGDAFRKFSEEDCSWYNPILFCQLIDL